MQAILPRAPVSSPVCSTRKASLRLQALLTPLPRTMATVANAGIPILSNVRIPGSWYTCSTPPLSVMNENDADSSVISSCRATVCLASIPNTPTKPPTAFRRQLPVLCHQHHGCRIPVVLVPTAITDTDPATRPEEFWPVTEGTISLPCSCSFPPSSILRLHHPNIAPASSDHFPTTTARLTSLPSILQQRSKRCRLFSYETKVPGTSRFVVQ
ncbi:hypothetical protein GE09DRAFT_1151760 [Coniochaeta sp. 2T2.1]|nr:hypothetical protein GE09DRAFT_1151760 [Coniochaeta sp. 2T2.1]